MIDITQHWTEQLKQKRGLLNGKRVQMARELRGLARYQLARKLGIAVKEAEKREREWCFWEQTEQNGLVFILDFPIAFFTQEDPMELPGPLFVCGTDKDGEAHCHVEKGN